jgi:hypothetical protein
MTEAHIFYYLKGKIKDGVWYCRRRGRYLGKKGPDCRWNDVRERETKAGDVLGFFHYHPETDLDRPSEWDLTQISKWNSEFNKDILCVLANDIGMRGFIFRPGTENLTAAGKVVYFKKSIIIAVEDVSDTGSE